jgi:hypothetical protein
MPQRWAMTSSFEARSRTQVGARRRLPGSVAIVLVENRRIGMLQDLPPMCSRLRWWFLRQAADFWGNEDFQGKATPQHRHRTVPVLSDTGAIGPHPWDFTVLAVWKSHSVQTVASRHNQDSSRLQALSGTSARFSCGLTIKTGSLFEGLQEISVKQWTDTILDLAVPGGPITRW